MPTKTEEYIALTGALSRAFQQGLSPRDAFELLKNGHERFQKGEKLSRNRAQLLADAGGGQYPYAAVLGCIDSRAPIEEVFDANIGDLFVARVAGNTVNGDLLGSLEYACKFAGSKLLVVLGHSQCGAIRGAWDGVEHGHITGLLNRLQPAVQQVKTSKGDEPSPENLNACVEVNVNQVIDRIRTESSTLAEMEQNGEIAIVGGVYHVDKGQVVFSNIPDGW